ncbi:MAG TPA: phosphoribosyltransferase family protein [Pricia sp.]|nr:phosphoribosyltransferase family protein [Pricia sp.]
MFFSEDGKVQRLIHHLKYKNQERISSFLGDWYGQILKGNCELTREIDMVIPVPLHAKKLRHRGYNQVAGFAQKLAAHLEADYGNDILIKTANNKTQTKKGRIGRWQDDRPLYTLSDADSLKNKRILLVDDVITTGATMELCAQTLQQTPGTTIYMASMAVVPKLWN